MDKLAVRPEVSQRVIDLITGMVDSQDVKGMAKYNETIDDAVADEFGDPYDWNKMALEEMVDGMKYMVKQNIMLGDRLRNEVRDGRSLRLKLAVQRARNEELEKILRSHTDQLIKLGDYLHENHLGEIVNGEQSVDAAIRFLKSRG